MMEKQLKVLDFKTVSPLFEMERDGIKPFTIRKVDKDSRFRALSQWSSGYKWAIRVTNPATGENFIREITNVDCLRWVDWSIASEPGRGFWDRLRGDWGWKVIHMGELIESVKH